MATVISTRSQLVGLAAVMGVRPDWHEPDEQDVTVEVVQGDFDNCSAGPDLGEAGVWLVQSGRRVAFVNMATLFAFATGYEGR